MVWNEIPEIILYSDGGAEPNPGKGGFGIIMVYKGIKKEFSQGYVLTTNNRMELMGVIYGLERLKTKSIVKVFTDSQYVINGIENGWAQKWKSKNWFRNKNDKAINFDLWDRLLQLISTQEKVTFNWVKGHDGHPENERCDELAMSALNSNNLTGFELS
jgi:ribonuclease HI